jgi:hypothetical protein
LSASVYAQQSQTYRDLLDFSYKAGENEQNRITNIAQTTISANATIASAGKAADSASSSALGSLLGKVVTSDAAIKFISGLF